MPLHERNTIRAQINDSLFASKSICGRRCPSTGSRPARRSRRSPLEAIEDELLLDGNARQNLATFCQTWEEPQVHG